jgi:hypothetical protein
MKITKLLAVAALINNMSLNDVAAVRHHRRHHHHHQQQPHQHLIQTEKIDDIHTKDPRYMELQKKKNEIQNQIWEETDK